MYIGLTDMTYGHLLMALYELPPCRLEDDVAVQVNGGDEFFQITGIGTSKKGDKADGILDWGHRYLSSSS